MVEAPPSGAPTPGGFLRRDWSVWPEQVAMIRFLIVFLSLALPVLGQTTLELHGRPVVVFELPGFEQTGQREGRVKRVYFEDGTLQLEVRLRSWIGVDKAVTEYRKERAEIRRKPGSRVGPEVAVPGAAKAFTYTTSEPFEGHGLLLFSQDFRCEFYLTGPAEPRQGLFQQLLENVELKS